MSDLDQEPQAELSEEQIQALFYQGSKQAQGEGGYIPEPTASETPEVIEDDVTDSKPEDVEPDHDPAAEIRGMLDEIEQFKSYKDRLESLQGFDPKEAQKQTEKLFGKLGSLEQQFKNAIGELAKENTGEVKVDADFFKELGADYDPALAEMIRLGVERSLANQPVRRIVEERTPEQAPIDLVEVERIIKENVDKARLEEREAAAKQALDAALIELDDDHPTWREDASTPEWNKWKSRQDEKYIHLIESTDNPRILNRAFTRFKAEQALINEKTEQKAKRLANAIEPIKNGNGAPAITQKAALTPEELYQLGMQRARGT